MTPCSFTVSLRLVHMLTVPKNIGVVSGHGTQVKDEDGDELDGFDECSWFFFVR